MENMKIFGVPLAMIKLILTLKNPDVIREFVKIIKFYLDNGIRLFRLDAIAFIWKEKDTNCINLSQTHEIVRLIRTLLDYTYENTVLLTETNILKEREFKLFWKWE